MFKVNNINTRTTSFEHISHFFSGNCFQTDLKHRFNNHTKSFNLEHYENDTELSKEYWTIKRNHLTPKVTCIRKCAYFSTTKRKDYLCLDEKFEIASYKGDNLLN